MISLTIYCLYAYISFNNQNIILLLSCFWLWYCVYAIKWSTLLFFDIIYAHKFLLCVIRLLPLKSNNMKSISKCLYPYNMIKSESGNRAKMTGAKNMRKWNDITINSIKNIQFKCSWNRWIAAIAAIYIVLFMLNTSVRHTIRILSHF